MALRYYLKIDGIAGGSTSEDHQGAFDVEGYSFDVSALVNATRYGGGGVGRTEFSPLTVDLDVNSGLASLLKLVASGGHIPSLQLQGVSDDGETVYDLRLGDVTVTSFHDSSTGHDTLSFDYRQVSVTTTEQNADGSLDEPETFSYDVAANRQGANIPEPSVPTDGAAGGEAQSYYLTIDGIAGDSTREGHEGAFDVDGYSFDVSALVNATRYGGGAGAGRSEFSPLTVNLDADSGLTSLLSHAASGRHIPSLQLQGVSADGQTVYDLRLGDVTVTRFQDSNGQDMLSFSYREVSVTTTGQNADGSLAEPETFSWDLAANRQGANIPEPHVPTDSGAGGEPQSYYMTIDGIAGDSTREGHEGAFDVEGYSFDVSALVNATRYGGGAGAGRSEFSPLTVNLDADSGLTSLLSHAASGQHIPSLQLQGVSADGQTVYDLRLGDVTVTRFQDSNGQDMLSFSYRQVSVTTTGQNPDGSLAEPETFSWDIAANRQGANIPEPSVPTDGAAAGGQAQSYYLTIDGIAGDSTRDGHEGAFDVDGYSFDISALVNATRYGGGAGAGRSEFSPLTVNLDADSGLTSLLSHAASGRHIPSLQLQGVSADGQTVYDLRLGDVTVTRFQDSDGQDMLSFSYREVSVTTTGQNADGSLAEPETFSWDLAANRQGANIPEPHVPKDNGAGGEPQSYYMTIDGIAGDSTREGHEGAFDVEGYSFDISALVNATRYGGGAGAGRSEFSPLTVSLDADSGLTSLLSHAASGQHISSLQLQGVSADGQTVYDLRLGDVTVTRFQDSNGQDMLSFSYSQVSVTTTGQNADGSLAEPETFSWDLAANRQGASIPEPHVPMDGAAGGEAQSYYMTIDGIAGDSTRDGHEGAFDVEGYSFDVSALVNATRYGGGAGAGRTEFSPLTVSLDADSGLTSLLSHAASGQHISSLQLQGVSADGETVYDLRLGDVTVTRFQDSNGQDMLSFSYRQVSVTTTGQNADGSLAEPETFSWDIAANRQGANIPEPRVPTDGDQALLNGHEADLLMGSPGGVLTGAHPGHDQFVFTGNFGHNEITNFSPSDHIVLERSHFGNASDILEHHASDDGHGNTVITDPLNPDNVIVLDHVSVEELEVSDFVLL